MPPVISFIGRSGSGKTTLLEKLIPELVGQGFLIGTVKHHHGRDFAMDIPGKDSWRHKQAGASVVALSSPVGLGVIRDTDHDIPLSELVSSYFNEMDLVIAEGHKGADIPQIEIFRSAVHPEPLPGEKPNLVAMVSDAEIARDVPVFALDDVAGLASFIVANFLKPGREAD